MIILGIDPGKTTAIAEVVLADEAWESGRLPAKLDQYLVLGGIWTGSLLDAMDRLRERKDLHPADNGGRVGLVVVEDARKLPIYAKRRGAKGQVLARIGRSVGRVDRDTELWLDWLARIGYQTHAQMPLREKKWDAKTLTRITGYEGRTNEHGRDAARLAWRGARRMGLQLASDARDTSHGLSTA